MHSNRKRRKKEQKALNISLLGSAAFVVLELVMSIYTSSQAVLLDAVYDGVELLMILFSIALVPLFYKPSSESHPFGYLQIETLLVVIKGSVMAAVTVGLVVNNIQIILNGGRRVDFSAIAYFELFCTVLSGVVILILQKSERNLVSPTLHMEIQEWKIDIVASLGMCAAFIFPIFVGDGFLTGLIPYLDQMIAIVLSLFIIPVPVRAVLTGIRDLTLMPPEEETVEDIKQIVVSVLQEYGYDKLYFDIVRTGRKLWISVYITFDKDEVSISRFRILQNFIIQALSKSYQDFYFELLPDIVYSGNTEI